MVEVSEKSEGYLPRRCEVVVTRGQVGSPVLHRIGYRSTGWISLTSWSRRESGITSSADGQDCQPWRCYSDSQMQALEDWTARAWWSAGFYLRCLLFARGRAGSKKILVATVCHNKLSCLPSSECIGYTRKERVSYKIFGQKAPKMMFWLKNVSSTFPKVFAKAATPSELVQPKILKR